MFLNLAKKMGLVPSTVTAPNPSGKSVESYVTGQVRPIKIGHMWTVSNIRGLCRRMKPGECVVSPIFFGGVKRCHQWRLVLYPCGNNAENAKHASLYLQLVSDSSTSDYVPSLAVKTTISLAIINSDGEEVNRFKPREQFNFVKERTLWGFGKFISHDKLLSLASNNKFLSGPEKNPRLSLFCDLNDCEPTSEMPAECNLAQVYAIDSIRKLSSDFEVLLRNNDMSDVKIETASRQFSAHKVILSARSPVFAAMFAHEMREKSENILVVEDVTAEIMAELLRYIYTGKVTDLQGNVMELLVVADKYALDDLKNMCEDVLFNSLTIDNAIDILILADMHNATKLKARITEFVIENSTDIAESNSFKTAMKSHSELIAEVFQKMATKK